MKNKIYLYNLNNELIETFNNYEECAEYFKKTKYYIKYSLEKRARIKKDKVYYKIKLEKNKSEIIKELEKENKELKNELRIKEERIKKLEKELQGVQLLVYESIKKCQQ